MLRSLKWHINWLHSAFAGKDVVRVCTPDRVNLVLVSLLCLLDISLGPKKEGSESIHKNMSATVPSRKLTYLTMRNGKSSSKVLWDGIV